MSGGGMFDPFSAWSRMVSAGLDMQSTWLRSAETMRASGDVIGVRTEMMRAATVAPLTGNYAELSRMVPEKVAAFSRSAVSSRATRWPSTRPGSGRCSVWD